MNSNFLLLSKTQKIIEYYNKHLINFPKKEYLLKQCIEKNMYELIECLFAYNINDIEKIKQKYLKDFLVKLSMLDFYTNVSYEKRAIGKRQLDVITKVIIEIRKMTYGLIRSNKQNDGTSI